MGIRVSEYKSEEFTALSLYFLGKDGAGKLVYILLRCKIHLVEDLRINLFIRNNIMLPENFVIDIKYKITFIVSCKVTVSIGTR